MTYGDPVEWVFPLLGKDSRRPHKMTLTEADMEEMLSHGSGINGDWYFDETKDGKKLICENLFETLTEYGYVDGDAYFTIIIPKEDPQEFRLMFHGRKSQYLNQKYMLRDYLEDTIAEDIRQWRYNNT